MRRRRFMQAPSIPGIYSPYHFDLAAGSPRKSGPSTSPKSGHNDAAACVKSTEILDGRIGTSTYPARVHMIALAAPTSDWPRKGGNDHGSSPPAHLLRMFRRPGTVP